ncbi:CPBP family intramembrane glutamic endopeptidase [Chamaesiphon minutus]|uniref:CAAX amino terminal protease family n=1 Tax=Chamaesiphon minutus (strain ATCC 27169 / PCC 6605) TaxID=1173020 RepID=K9UPM5_CHAP6|nr:type II CAAX endopeptidase family protein [Chamaesiphon minutus]AFY96159.1 CAAX amino terminal protease family [Chamaesiphon minutus PCC 6605]
MLNFSQIKNYPAPGRMFCFILVLALIWLPGLAIIYLVMSSTQNLEDPATKNLLSILTMGLLAIEFIALLPWWGRKVYEHPNLYARYGLVFTRQNGLLLLKGLAIGASFAVALFITQGLLGWLTWQSPRLSILQLALEGSATALGVGLAEELFFRGWMLDELERDYAPKIALIIDASLFALLHFLKPIPVILASLPQFPGLVLLGIVVIVAKHQHRNLLGISIGLHAGMVWAYYIVNVGNMVKYSGRVSDWITGINGNPISGILGLIFLGILAVLMSNMSKTFDRPKV